MTASRPAAVVVLAAGAGTRMRSTTPKVLHEICGRTLIAHVLAAVGQVDPIRTLVVLGVGRDRVGPTLPAGVVPVVQAEQRGTGHAVRVALAAIPPLGADEVVLVLPGDAPLITARTLADLLTAHAADPAPAVTLLTAELDDPAGYGRVCRGPDGEVQRVVEERDAGPAERALREVATSVYAFRAATLQAGLAELDTDNAQGEEYLTDVVGWARGRGERVRAHRCPDPDQALGVNDRVQLSTAGRAMRDRLVREAMLAGASVLDPASTWLEPQVRIEPDATIHPNTQLHGRTVIEAGAEVGPNVSLRDTRVRAGARVHNAVCVGADIGPQAQVGPYTYLRPGTVLGPRAKAGSYVEIKAASVGEGSKVPHLSYVGDATIGRDSNIGAATVFVNYDGRDKHHSEVGDGVRIGSDTMLVAPVRIGDGAYTAAGSVITEDVPPGALAVARARQRTIEGWVARRRPAHRRPGAPDAPKPPTGPAGPSEADSTGTGPQ